MPLTRRAFAGGSAILAAAAILPARAQPALMVRRSINDLIREQSPIVDSYRRGVDAMMKRPITDRTSWWFQANIHDHSDVEGAQWPSYASYWKKCPHKNYFFLNWHRMYLHFFERIVRKAADDPEFTLPYWAYEDPSQASLPIAFLPDSEEFGTPPDNKAVAYMSRKNALARAKRHGHVDHRWIGLGDVSRDVSAALALDRFTATDKLDALKAFGGMRVTDAATAETAGGIEASPHNLVHKTIGLDGDMGGTDTAARDPIFWLHHCNIDRMWAKWTDPTRGRIPPVDDDVWMQTKFTFVDENGEDRVLTGADVLDTQFQLGYRYDDDPPRTERLTFEAAVAAGPGGATLARGALPMQAPAPVLLARGATMTLQARESQIVLTSVPRQGRTSAGPVTPARLRVVLRDVVARDGAPPYDVFLVLEGTSLFDPSTTSVRIGALDLFGGAGTGHHGHAGGSAGETIAFDATEAVARLSRLRGYELGRLRVTITRRGFPLSTGGEFVPPDSDPPKIGAIELLQS
ncbi:MAG: polyphenol oxidase [Alphaproteobacteria bacterium]|jgi:tyrosinase|nr:polyphenol oxidase [Alphaproteobacteria bacterium]